MVARPGIMRLRWVAGSSSKCSGYIIELTKNRRIQISWPTSFTSDLLGLKLVVHVPGVDAATNRLEGTNRSGECSYGAESVELVPCQKLKASVLVELHVVFFTVRRHGVMSNDLRSC